MREWGGMPKRGTAAPKRKPGRPSVYRPEACETVMQLGREGASRAEFALELGISFQTMRNWENTHPEFLEATTRAKELSQAWWEKQGRAGIWSRDFNAPAYRLQMLNRFRDDWRDKHDHEHTGKDGGPLDISIRFVDGEDGE
jgi:hypothetical protein